MDNVEIKEMLECFCVESYFKWHERLYLSSLETDKWTESQVRLRMYETETYKMPKKEYFELIKLDSWNILNYYKTDVINDIEDNKGKKRQIKILKQSVFDRLKEYTDIIEAFENKQPILIDIAQSGGMETTDYVSLFGDLRKFEFLHDLDPTIEINYSINTPSVLDPKTEQPVNILPWNGTQQSICYHFHLLKKAGKLKGDTNIAKHIVSNYQKTDGSMFVLKDIETIRKQVNDTNPLPKEQDRKVLDIINKAILDIDKVLKIK